jgi:uncharacterized protein (DUF1330 family)
MPKAYVIVSLTVTDPQKFAAHLPLSDLALDKFGGRFIVVRQSKSEVLEGSPAASPLSRTLVLEFDDYDTAVNWYRSPEYDAARLAREGAADLTMVVVEGV